MKRILPVLIAFGVVALLTMGAQAQTRISSGQDIARNTTVTSGTFWLTPTVDSVSIVIARTDSTSCRFRVIPVSKVGTADVVGDTSLVQVVALAGAGVHVIPWHWIRAAFSGNGVPVGFRIQTYFAADKTALNSTGDKQSIYVREFK